MVEVAGPDEPTLTDRQREILQAIIEDYIATAEPVGSRGLTRRRKIDLSPATVRNAMADLEELGLLSAPFSSSGRIPTPLAFRIYVSRLAQRGRISSKDRELVHAITRSLGSGPPDISTILREAGRVLSAVSKHASLVLMPIIEEVVFAHIEFVPVREQSILAVFVAKSGFIQNRLIDLDEAIPREDLQRMSNYLNSLLDGKTLREVRLHMLEAMDDERNAADHIMRRALMLGERALRGQEERDMVIEGERRFLDQPEFADIQKMRQLLRAFEEKTLILHLLDAAARHAIDSQAASSADTAVVLGSESTVREFRDLAAVTSSYSSEHGPLGRVGVVGPVRMNYARVIPLVELTAAAVTSSLAPASRGLEIDVEPEGLDRAAHAHAASSSPISSSGHAGHADPDDEDADPDATGSPSP
ncbi:MAG: heat-inducible transcription repressor HrcA [Deltaproteobacteria bacterium]|nr:heat-inducible transcription repressor HrcA [Deltaproteobacteria bacterium]